MTTPMKRRLSRAAPHSPHDADAMSRFQADLGRYAQLIRKTLLRTPPDPSSFKPGTFRSSSGWQTVLELGERELYEYIRFFTMSAADFLHDYFEDDLIKAAMASPGIIGTRWALFTRFCLYSAASRYGRRRRQRGCWGLAEAGWARFRTHWRAR